MGSYQQYLSRPYIHISPQYRMAYEKAVREDFEDQTVVAAMDFAENYFGRRRYFRWGFMVFTDTYYSQFYNIYDADYDTYTPLSYDKVGKQWRSWFGDEYKDYRWVEPREVAPAGQPIEFDCAWHSWNFHLGAIANWRGPMVECEGKIIHLHELLVCRSDPEEVEYYLTFREEDGNLVQSLFYALDTWKNLEKAHNEGWISNQGFAAIGKKFWRWMDGRLREHEARQAWLASLSSSDPP